MRLNAWGLEKPKRLERPRVDDIVQVALHARVAGYYFIILSSQLTSGSPKRRIDLTTSILRSRQCDGEVELASGGDVFDADWRKFATHFTSSPSCFPHRI